MRTTIDRIVATVQADVPTTLEELDAGTRRFFQNVADRRGTTVEMLYSGFREAAELEKAEAAAIDAVLAGLRR